MVEEILSELSNVKIIDTHEHFWDESSRLMDKGDWVLLFHQYGKDYFTSAGMTEEEMRMLFFSDASYEQKWSVFSKYWAYIKNAACIRAICLGIKDIYGIDRITFDSMMELNERIESTVTEGFMRETMGKKANIEYCMVNTFDADKDGNRYPVRFWGDTEFLIPDISADELILPPDRGYINFLSELTKTDGSDLAGWLRVIDRCLEMYAPVCKAIKIALAYKRDLNFDDSLCFAEAERSFASGDFSRCSDYIFHYLIRKSIQYGLPVKFHTGLHSGCGVYAMEAQEKNPEHLAQLAAKYPEAKIVALHMAYPFERKLALASKQFFNLYVDMSWVWSFDPEESKIFMKSFIHGNALNKIAGFGGDHFLPEISYAYSKMALQTMAEGLSEMVTNGFLTQQDACDMGRIILRESPRQLYGA